MRLIWYDARVVNARLSYRGERSLVASRLTAWACAVALGACSSSSDDGSKMTVAGGGNPFGNSTQGSAGMDGTSGASGGGVGNATGGAGGTTGGIKKACVEGSAQASRVVPTVMLVLDGSCSMSTDYPSTSGMSATRCEDSPNSRWSALRNVLLAPTDGIVTRLEGVVQFGAAVYGTEPTCPIPGMIVTPTLMNRAAIEAQYPTVPPGRYTPTGPALDQVYDQVLAPMAAAPDRGDGPLIILLATDGEPNSCDAATTNYQPSIDAVTRIAGGDVTTYVVSLAAAAGEFHDHLQQLANIGQKQDPAAGTAPLYEPANPEQLSADLELLIGGAVGCDVALNGTIDAGGECLGEVTLNGFALACNDANGFVLTDERHIRLQGTACDQFMSGSSAMVHVSFPCSVFRPD